MREDTARGRRDRLAHPSLGIDEQLASGTSKNVTVTAPPSGSPLVFCRFQQGQGMQGAISIG